MKKQFFTLLFSIAVLSLFAQEAEPTKKGGTDLSEFEQKVIALGLTIVTDTLVENRKKANKELGTELMSTLQQKGTFTYPFDSLQTVSIQYPSDSTFRIFTWQLYVDINEYQYSGFIQTNEEEPKIIKLTDKSVDMDDVILDYEIMTPDNWYGAIYYNIMSFDTPEGKKHLLFGFDGYQFFQKRKTIDVLTVENGTAIFGAAVFTPLDPRRTDLIKNRVLLQYAAGSNMTMNFKQDLDMIVFDNLIPQNDLNGRPSYVPDGSYCGYQLKDGLWVYVDKVFDQVSETPPMPAPILDKRKKKDIFGQ